MRTALLMSQVVLSPRLSFTTRVKQDPLIPLSSVQQWVVPLKPAHYKPSLIDLEALTYKTRVTRGKQAKAGQPERLSGKAPKGDATVRPHGRL